MPTINEALSNIFHLSAGEEWGHWNLAKNQFRRGSSKKKEIRETQMKEKGRKESADCPRPLEDEVTALWFKETVCVTEGENVVQHPQKAHTQINGV
jgi:hypothetical protein